MTPFGSRLRDLRESRNITQATMAQALGVSAAYLSALEHGKRGRPSWQLVQRIITYFNVIWDEAEELTELARLSHPRITIDTAGLDPLATEVANRLAKNISGFDEARLQEILALLKTGREKNDRPSDGFSRFKRLGSKWQEAT